MSDKQLEGFWTYVQVSATLGKPASDMPVHASLHLNPAMMAPTGACQAGRHLTSPHPEPDSCASSRTHRCTLTLTCFHMQVRARLDMRAEESQRLKKQLLEDVKV